MRPCVAATICVCCCLAGPSSAIAQPAEAQAEVAPAVPLPRDADRFWTPFTQLGGDFARFVSPENLRIIAPTAVGAAAMFRLDDDGIEMAMRRLQPAGGFRAGNIGGGFYAQTGGAVAFYTLARLTGSARLSRVGADLVRAQIVTQGTVQAMKLATRRTRPDGSDRLSLPSGHAAGTFATATVLQRHYGWRAGLPAYVAGAYVAASRMSANRHHLTDVIVGAAFGIAAGRSVTIGANGQRFNVSLSPIPGGGAITVATR